jgi:hypothetical protein
MRLRRESFILRVETSELDAFHRELAAKQYKYVRPGIEAMPWGLVNPSTTYRPMERRPGYWEYDAERKPLLNEGPAK